MNEAVDKVNAIMANNASSLELLTYELGVQQDLISYLQSRQNQAQQELKDAPAQHREFVHGQIFEAGKLLALIDRRKSGVQTWITKLETLLGKDK